ncbi:MAG: hypothetical protein KBB86_01665 [Candidatus Pacebacteria bacterium]|nr:hypothetical protein [Candidatus Paceibacterota bacterium]
MEADKKVPQKKITRKSDLKYPSGLNINALKDVYQQTVGVDAKLKNLSFDDFLRAFDWFIFKNEKALTKLPIQDLLEQKDNERKTKFIKALYSVCQTRYLTVVQNYINRYVDFILNDKLVYYDNSSLALNNKGAMFDHKPVER